MSEMNRGKDFLSTNEAESKQQQPPPSPVMNVRRRDSIAPVLQLSPHDSTWHETSVNYKKKKPHFNIMKPSTYLEIINNYDTQYRLVTFLLFVAIIFLMFYVTYLSREQRLSIIRVNRIDYKESDRISILLDPNGGEKIRIYHGLNIPKDIDPRKCTFREAAQTTICRDWKFRAQFKLNHQRFDKIERQRKRQNKTSIEINPISGSKMCYHYEWLAYSANDVLRDCFELGDHFWFGMGSNILNNHPNNPLWPLNNQNFEKIAFVTGNNLVNNVIKRFWLSSNGVSITVPLNVPLFVSFNSTDRETGFSDNLLCLEAKTNRHPFNGAFGNDIHPILRYSVCSSNNITELVENRSRFNANLTSLRSVFNETSCNLTDFRLNPVHSQSLFNLTETTEALLNSTCEKYMTFIKRHMWTVDRWSLPEIDNLTSYVNKLFIYGLDPAFIILDRRWQHYIGDFKFRASIFGNETLQAFLTSLEEKNFKILLTVSPMIEMASPRYNEVVDSKRIYHDLHLHSPVLISCGELSEKKFCAALDLMNQSNRVWLRSQLEDFEKIKPGRIGFFFEGITVSRLPLTNLSCQYINPDFYQIALRDTIRDFKFIGLDTVADETLPIGFVHIGPVESSWRTLQSLVSTVLSMNLIGYPLISVGAVGGDFGENRASGELFIRWFELATFLPILRLPALPGSDISIIKLTKKCLATRKSLVIPLMRKCLKENLLHGWPIIRPIWWLESEKKETFKIDDQFLIGNDVLVAPILNANQTTRDIYLPNGNWKDAITSKIEKGGRWLMNYTVDLNSIAYFKREESS